MTLFTKQYPFEDDNGKSAFHANRFPWWARWTESVGTGNVRPARETAGQGWACESPAVYHTSDVTCRYTPSAITFAAAWKQLREYGSFGFCNLLLELFKSFRGIRSVFGVSERLQVPWNLTDSSQSPEGSQDPTRSIQNKSTRRLVAGCISSRVRQSDISAYMVSSRTYKGQSTEWGIVSSRWCLQFSTSITRTFETTFWQPNWFYRSDNNFVVLETSQWL